MGSLYLNNTIKYQGTSRSLDDRYRLYIPPFVRAQLQLSPGDTFEVFTEGTWIHLKQNIEKCAFCGSIGIPLIEFKEKYICHDCLNDVKEGNYEQRD